MWAIFPAARPALTYIRADGLLGLVASNFGSRTAPQWFRNLEAHPEATVQIKRHRWAVHARLATPDEHARIWRAALVIWPAWAAYAQRTNALSAPRGRFVPLRRAIRLACRMVGTLSGTNDAKHATR